MIAFDETYIYVIHLIKRGTCLIYYKKQRFNMLNTTIFIRDLIDTILVHNVCKYVFVNICVHVNLLRITDIS